MHEMCDNLTYDSKANQNHAFIICTGDLAEALSVDKGQKRGCHISFRYMICYDGVNGICLIIFAQFLCQTRYNN